MASVKALETIALLHYMLCQHAYNVVHEGCVPDHDLIQSIYTSAVHLDSMYGDLQRSIDAPKRRQPPRAFAPKKVKTQEQTGFRASHPVPANPTRRPPTPQAPAPAPSPSPALKSPESSASASASPAMVPMDKEKWRARKDAIRAINKEREKQRQLKLAAKRRPPPSSASSA